MNNRVLLLILLAVFLIAFFAALLGSLLQVTLPEDLANLLRIIGGLSGFVLIIMFAYRYFKRSQASSKK